MIDLGRMRALWAVAQHGSVGGAAAALGFTPSAVSQQLARLERETGSVLVEREGRGIRLTDAGILLAEHARDLLDRAELAAAALQEHRGSVTGRLAIGAFATASRALLPDVLATLRHDHPDLDLRFDELDPHLVMAPLLSGELDLAVTHGWDDLPLVVPEGTTSFSLGTDKADLVVRADHPFARRGAVPVDEVVRVDDWISSPRGSVCHRWLTEAMRRQGIEPRLQIYAAEYSTQFELVVAGLGIALVVRLARPSLPPGLRVVRLDPAPARLIQVVVRTAGARRPAVQAGVQALQQSWSRWELSQVPA